MHPRIRWGIIATGNIAGQFARDLALLPDHEVVAVGSRNLQRAKAFAEEHGVRKAYGSYAELVADLEVDVVYVATPHSDHLATSRLALNAGKAVLCEKSLTVNAREARELVNLAREKQLFFMEAMWMRCNPLHLRLAELVKDGVIGEPKALHASLGFVAEYDPRGRLFAPELAGGALLDVGVYPVSLAYHVFGPPDVVQATGTLAPTGVDASVAIALGYQAGQVASLACSLVSTLPNEAWVSGTEGWIVLPRSFHDTHTLVVHREGREPEAVSVERKGIGYTYEAIEVARCLREGLVESPLVSWNDSLAVMDVLDAVRKQVGVRYPVDDAP
ncbi:MAG TPA: Gfo/Idh/MocA family oxidoreductase [Actinopolymorphaceae bacterium]